MNRRKHPDKAPYRRTANTGDKTRNTAAFRVTASWDSRPDRPAIRPTSDKAAARRLAAEFADSGAYVVIERHKSGAQWRTVAELDGPALVAERLAAEAEQHAAERRRAAEKRRAAVDKAEHGRELAALERLMVRPPGNRDARARHITGTQRA